MAGWEQQLDEGAADILGRPLALSERAAFGKYLDLLVKWQRVHRLVGSADPDWIVAHIFLDSLTFDRVLPADVARVLDFGSGAGVPGIPVKIVRPAVHMTLLEARRRRASFLADVVRRLGLTSCDVLADRAEVALLSIGPVFDAVVMRCAGSAADVVPLALGFVRPGGLVVASGPPGPALASQEWVEVPTHRGGAPRRFRVDRKSE